MTWNRFSSGVGPVALLGIAALAAGLGCSRPDGPRRPNVVLISIDSLRADRLHCYGNQAETSPNIDRVAAEGTLFTRTVAESPWTLPSHATLFTGVSQAVHRAGFGGVRIPEALDTLPEVLKSIGYDTFGVWSGPFLHPFFGFGQGFEPGDYRSALGETEYDRGISTSDEGDRERMSEAHRQAHAGNTSAEIADAAISFLNADHERPFFLFLHFFDVHFDYVPPEPYWRRFDPDYQGSLDPRDYAHNPAINKDLPPRERQHLWARYDGEIRFTDEQIGRVLDQLAASGLADDTLLVITADHGEEFFEHGEKGHLNGVYDEVLLVPLVMRLPGVIEAGARSTGQVRHIDVMPTILDLVGLPAPSGVLGSSLAPQLGGGVGVDRPAVSRLQLQGETTFTSVRLPSNKLLLWGRPDLGTTRAVFDLRADAGEQNPLKGLVVRDEMQQLVGVLEKVEGAEHAVSARLEHGADAAQIPADLETALREMGYLNR